MIDQERDLLAEYCKETNYPWTLMTLIDDHRYLANERVEVEVSIKKAEARGFREGMAHAFRSTKLLNELVRREE